QDVVGEAKLTQLRHAFDEIVADEEAVIGLGLRDVAETAKFWELGEELQARGELGGAQVNPSDDTGNALVTVCQVQQEERFVFGLVGLHGDGGVHAAGYEFGGEIVWGKVA